MCVSLNAAMATDGVVIAVDDGAALNSRFISSRHDGVVGFRVYAFAGAYREGRHVTLVESFVAASGAKSYQVNDAVVVTVGDGADAPMSA